jgi:hypothetical protein
MTYALREAREYAAQSLPAQTARRIALHALVPLEFRGPSFHAACTRSAPRPIKSLRRPWFTDAVAATFGER